MRGARLAVTEAGVVNGAASPTLSRLSRYPMRTAPAVPGLIHTRLRQPAAATKPPCWRTRATLPSSAPSQPVSEPASCLDAQRGQARWTPRGTACGIPGVAAARIVGG
jgi:hypothetical protein